jgi:hypothetical protein
METTYSKCGADCTRCPSYKENLLTEEDRQSCSQGWFTYHGFRLKPEKLIACDGCQPVGENGNGTRYISCIVRRCALHNGIQSCGHCAEYPCQVLSSRILGGAWVDDLEKKMGSIPQDDFDVFVEPYLAVPHLDAVRAGLKPDEITAIKEVSLKPKIVILPDELVENQDKKHVYQLLESLNAPISGLSHAQAETQKERRRHILKILWSFAAYGDLDDEGVIWLDHKDYHAQKIHSDYDRVCSYLENLAAHGIHSEIVPLWEEDWLTPTRALRKQRTKDNAPPWMMKMIVSDRIGGSQTADAIQSYARALMDEFGKTAFRRFSRGDMRVLLP